MRSAANMYVLHGNISASTQPSYWCYYCSSWGHHIATWQQSLPSRSASNHSDACALRMPCHAFTGVAHLGTSALLKSRERCCTTTVPTNTHIVSARGPGHTGRKTSDAFCNTHARFSAFNTAHTSTVMYSKQQYRHTTGIRNKVQTSALASAPRAHEGAHGAFPRGTPVSHVR